MGAAGAVVSDKEVAYRATKAGKLGQVFDNGARIKCHRFVCISPINDNPLLFRVDDPHNQDTRSEVFRHFFLDLREAIPGGDYLNCDVRGHRRQRVANLGARPAARGCRNSHPAHVRYRARWVNTPDSVAQ